MNILDFKAYPVRAQVFKSAWVHTLTQVVWAWILLGKEALYLPLLLSSGVGIFYLPFQFPITGLLLVAAYKLTNRYFAEKHVLMRVAISSAMFVVMALSVVFLVIYLANLWQLSDVAANVGSEDVLVDTLKLMFYIAPAFLLGETFRQTLFLKKIYQ